MASQFNRDELDAELGRRYEIFSAVQNQYESSGSLKSSWLDAVPTSWGKQRCRSPQRGIWNPSDFMATLSIVSDQGSKYDDGDHLDLDSGNSLYRYSYEEQSLGRDPRGGSNSKLRLAMKLKLPILMLRKFGAGLYIPVAPVYVVQDEESEQRFLLALDENSRMLTDPDEATSVERRYNEQVVRQRLHQPMFRTRVLNAYKIQCAICNLKRAKLLDAAHITPDSQSGGEAVVSNGLSLCKIHHAAFDTNIVGISPDYVVHVNQDVLHEVDGPMLKHGLQEMNDRKLWVPHSKVNKPDRNRLSQRFDEFLAAG